MKDLLTMYNLSLISRTLNLLFPKYKFIVTARYDPMNFVYVFTIKPLENGEVADEALPITVYVDDLYNDIDETLASIIDEASNMMEEMGY